MSSSELSEMADALQAEGHSQEAERLRAAAGEFQSVEQPPGLLSRTWDTLRRVAQEQLGHLQGEVEESKELATLLKRRISRGQELTPEQHDQVRSQLLDVFRIVPAGVVAAVNCGLPIPGTGWFTPLLLKRMGLLPSRWREAHALKQLEDEVEHLRARGLDERAQRLDELIDQLEREADERETIERSAALLSHWDANGNGEWDPEERAAYQAALAKAKLRASSQGHRKLWFFQLHGNVMGSGRLTQLRQSPQQTPADLLVCYEGTGWVAWHDLEAQHEA